MIPAILRAIIANYSAANLRYGGQESAEEVSAEEVRDGLLTDGVKQEWATLMWTATKAVRESRNCENCELDYTFALKQFWGTSLCGPILVSANVVWMDDPA